MVEATDFANRDDPAEFRPLNSPAAGRVLVERKVSTRPGVLVALYCCGATPSRRTLSGPASRFHDALGSVLTTDKEVNRSFSAGVLVLVRSGSGPTPRFAAVCARFQAAEEGQVRRRLNLVAEPLNRWTRSQGCHR